MLGTALLDVIDVNLIAAGVHITPIKGVVDLGAAMLDKTNKI